MKTLIKLAAERLNIELYQRFMAYSILNDSFSQLRSVNTFTSRERLWDASILALPGNRLSFIEFGVHEGYSISYFARNNANHLSKFTGFDSFQGLPENWGGAPRGTFDTGGAIPVTEDRRITFIKGWFQDTLDNFLPSVDQNSSLIVHYDADLYSSTLYALSKIDSLNRKYLAIFDEFTGHETRALYNYIQAYSASVKFLGKTLQSNSKYPEQVLCELTPRKTYVRTGTEDSVFL